MPFLNIWNILNGQVDTAQIYRCYWKACKLIKVQCAELAFFKVLPSSFVQLVALLSNAILFVSLSLKKAMFCIRLRRGI